MNTTPEIRNGGLQRVCWVGFSVAFLAFTALVSTGQPVPDAQALIQGMRSARAQVPPSRLRIRSLYESQFHQTDLHFVVEFDGKTRRYTKVGAQTGDQAMPGEILEEFQYDGKEVTHFNGQSVNVFDLGKEYGIYGFDFRLLGITSTYQSTEGLPCYRFQPPWKVELVGEKVAISGNDTWQVRATNPNPAYAEYNFWIDDKDFRVHRFEQIVKGHGREVVESSYDDSYPWLPVKVEQTDFDSEGQPMKKRVLTIIRSEANVRFPTNEWTLAGMRLPTDVPVVDLRIQRRIGYWDGTTLQLEDSPETPASEPSTWTGRRMVVLALLGTVLLASAGWVSWRLRMGTRSTPRLF